MTIRPRAAKNVREMRSRLRDIAAASHANTLAARDQSRAVANQHESDLEQHLDGAQLELAGASSIYDLEQVGEDTGQFRLAVDDANAQLQEITKETVISEAALRERARQLRSAERIVEKIERSISHREARAEQRINDDISARRR